MAITGYGSEELILDITADTYHKEDIYKKKESITMEKLKAMGPTEFLQWLDKTKKEEETRNSRYKRFLDL